MAVVSTWLVDSQVRKANMPQEIGQQVNFHSVSSAVLLLTQYATVVFRAVP